MPYSYRFYPVYISINFVYPFFIIAIRLSILYYFSVGVEKQSFF